MSIWPFNTKRLPKFQTYVIGHIRVKGMQSQKLTVQFNGYPFIVHKDDIVTNAIITLMLYVLVQGDRESERDDSY